MNAITEKTGCRAAPAGSARRFALRALLAGYALALALHPGDASAQVSYVGTGTASDTTAYATSVTPGLPTGWAQGDLLLVVAHFYGAASVTIQTPSGYTQIGTNTASTTYGTLAVFHKFATTSETAPTVALSTGATAGKFTAQMFAFRGVNTTTPIDVAGSISDQAAPTATPYTWTGTALTTVTGHAMVIFAGGSRDDDDWTAWAGSIDAGVFTVNTVSTNDNSIFLGYNSQSDSSTAGLQAAPSADQTGPRAPDAGRSLTFALRPGAPVAPGTPTASSQTASGWSATWTASTGADSYTLQVDTENTFAAPLTATYTPTGNSQAVSGLSANTTYYMRASATGPGGTSGWSGTGQGLTLAGAPTMNAFTNVTATSLSVNWTPTGSTTGVSYTVQRWNPTTSAWENVSGCVDLTAATTTCPDSGLSANTLYDYHVLATNTSGGNASTTASQRTRPGAPTIGTFSGITASALTVNWSPAGASTGLTYTVQRWNVSSWQNVTSCVDLPDTTTSCSDSGLAGNTSYDYQVLATNGTGTDASATASQLTVPAQLAAPTAAMQGSAIRVTYAAATGGGTITEYRIYRSVNGGAFAFLASDAGTPYDDAAVSAGNGYAYQVSAVNGTGEGVLSSASNTVTIALAPPGTPGTPGFVNLATNSVRVTWTAATGADSYKVERSADVLPRVWSQIAASVTAWDAGNSWYYYDSGSLSAGTKYWYQVRGTNGAGDGSYSGEASVTTLSLPPLLNVASLTQPTGGDVAQGATQAPAVRLAVSATQSDATLTTLRVQNTGSALPGSDVAVLKLWVDNDGSGTVSAGDAPLGTSTWDSVASRYVFSGLSYVVTSGAAAKQLLVTLDVAAGATPGRTFAASIATADVAVASGSVSPFTTITGNSFTVVAGATEGSSVAGRPIVLIVNPGPGPVTSGTLASERGFRVQARVYSPGGRALVGNVELSTDGGNTWSAMALDTSYGSDPLNGVYGPPLVGGYRELKLAPGGYTLVVRAANDLGPVLSGRVAITVTASGSAFKGDGNLLVRDNASRLCEDCHDLGTHSAQSTSTKFGSWAVSCRTCHTPHETTNIYLMNQEITPPAVSGPQVPKAVVFTKTTGLATGAKGDGSYVNDNYTGVCQVCHTRTDVYRSSAGGATHETGPCATCHGHEKGFRGGYCQKCHLTAAAVADTDNYVFGDTPTPIKSMISRDEWLASGHGRVLASGAYLSGNAAANFDAQGTADDDQGCAYCHSKGVAHNVPANFFRLTRNENDAGDTEGLNGTCLKCHGTLAIDMGAKPGASYAQISGAKKVDAAHVGLKHGGLNDDGGQYCWDCHDPHGDKSGGAQNLWYMVQRVPVANSDAGGVPAASIMTPAVVVSAVEFRPEVDNDTPPASNNLDYLDYIGGAANPTPTTGFCRNCHATTTVDHYAVGTSDGHFVANGKTANNRCTDCHKHRNAFQARCNTCHNSPPNVGKHYVHDEVAAADPSVIPAAYAGSTRTSATQYGFACSSCHSGTHVNDTHAGTSLDPFRTDVIFSGGGTYTPSGATADQGPDPLQYFAWGNGSCGSTYCHSNAAPVGGANLAAAPTWNESPPWTASNRCTKCHQFTADNPANPASTKLSHSHWVHVTTNAGGGYYLGCAQCHNGVATGQSDYPTAAASIANKALHVNGGHDVAFDAAFNPGTTGYDQGPAYTCTNTYCHSNGTSASSPPANTSIAWNSAGSTCASCHPGAATLATGTHASHVNNDAGLGTSYACGDCHQSTVAAGTSSPVSDRTKHVNRTKDVSIANRGTQASTQPVGGDCSAVYCHSNGRDPAASDATRYAGVTWGQVLTLDCKGCHGRGAAATGAPDYPDGATLAEANTHSLHTGGLGDATTCEGCHANTVTPAGTAIKSASTTHTNGTRNVDILAAYDLNGGTSNYDGTTKTCSAVSCHGTSAMPVWGTELACNACHGTPPTGGAHAKHDQTGTFTAYADTLNQTTDASYGFACSTCHQGVHGNSTATGASAATAKYVEVTSGLGYSGGGAATLTETGAGGIVFGYYTDRSCTTSTCHSNGGPLQSNGTNAAPAYAPVTWATTRDCAGCHGFGDAPGTMSAPHAKHIRANANASYAYGCHQCHQTTTTTGNTVTAKTKHADGVNDQVAFLASMNPSPAAYDTGTFTCNSTYCHSNAQPGAARVYKAPKWTDAVGSMPADCSGCHGGNATAVAKISASNDHAAHMDQAYLGTNIACGRCHAGTVDQSNDRAIVSPTGYASHVNGTADVSMVNVDATAAGTYGGSATKTCSNVYCHSDGTETPGFVNTELDWDFGYAKANDCKQCHGTEAGGIAGAPWYTNSTASDDTRNSHPQHVSSAADCVDCHDGTANASGGLVAGSLHLNKVGDVSAGTGKKIAGTYTQAGETCTSITCHNGGTAQWGATLTCSNCHTRTLAQGGDLENWALNDDIASAINSDEFTARGHGNTVAAYDEFTGATDRCLYCHDRSVVHGKKQTPSVTNPFRLRGAANSAGATGAYDALSASNGNDVCLNCHATSAAVRYGVDPDGAGGQPLVGGAANPAETQVDAWHHAAGKHGATADGGKRCWDCHDPHGDGSNIKMIGGDVIADAADDFGLAATRWTGVAFTANAAGTDYAGAATKVCNACHGTNVANPALHYTRAASDGHFSSQLCVRCHLHERSPANNAFQESAACNECHNAPPTAGAHAKHLEAGAAAVPASYSGTVTPTPSQYAFSCSRCHSGTHYDSNTNPLQAQVVFDAMNPSPAAYTVGGTSANETGPTGLVFRSTNGACASTYCHDPQGAGYSPANPTWVAGALGCASCHDDANGVATTTLPGAHGKHATNASGAYNYGCEKCHANTVVSNAAFATGANQGKVQHVDGDKNDVKFNTSPLDQSAGTFSGGSSGTCSNTYCHSNGVDRDPAGGFTSGPSIAWNGTVDVECDSCHGGNASATATTGVGKLATNDHAAHMDQAYLGTNIACGRCHAGTVSQSNDRAISSTGYASHVNGTADVSMVNVDATAAGTYGGSATKTCSNVYCHSDGTETPGFVNTELDWDFGYAKANDCKQCHGTEAGGIAGAPWYTNSTASDDTRNSHPQHVSSAADCVDCHDGTANASGGLVAGSLHLNKVGDVSAGTGKKIAGTYTQAGETCTSITCHNGGTAQWGATLTCSACHTRTLAQGGDLNNWDVNDTIASAINSDEFTARGHGNSGTGYEEFTGATDRCAYCHNRNVLHGNKQTPTVTNPFRLRGASDATGATAAYDTTSALTIVAVCLNCHDVEAPNGVDPDGQGVGQPKVGPATKRIDAYHHGTAHGATQDGGLRCWDCHDVHGDGNNLAMIGTDTLRDGTDVHGLAGTRSTNGAVLTNQGAGGYANTITRDGICQVCHTTTKYWRYASEPAGHNSGTDCISCHAHEQPDNNAFRGAGACSGCHMGAASAISDSDTDEFPPVYSGGDVKSFVDPEDWLATGHGRTAASGAYPQSGIPAANFPAPTQTVDPCYYCHAPDKPIYTGGPTSTHDDIGTGANPFRLLNTSNGANKNGVCLVCHAPASPGFDPDNSDVDTTYARINRTTSTAIDSYHADGHHDATHDGGTLCWDCHDPHGDWNYANSRPIAYMIQARPTLDGDANGWGSPSGCPTACQVSAAVVDFVKEGGTVANDFDGADYVRTAAPWAGVCQVCHESTTTDSTVNPVLYWKSDGSNAAHRAGQIRCRKCHSHQQSPSNNAFAQATACNGCHGTAIARTPVAGGADVNLNAAPPSGLLGETDTTQRAVGAHISHVNQDNLRSTALPCAECHNGAPPAAAHNEVVDVTWGTLATTGSITNMNWSGTGCSNTYCHGNFKNAVDQVTAPPLPGAPSGLVFPSRTTTSLTLSWTVGTNARIYKVERGSSSTGPWVQVGTTAAASFTDGGLTQSTTYWYRVRSWNTAGDSTAYCTPVSADTLSELPSYEFDMVNEPAATSLPTDGNTNVLTTMTSLTATTATTFTNRNVTTQNYVYADSTRRRDQPAAAMVSGTTYNFIDLYSPQLTASNNTVAAGVQVSVDNYMATTGTANPANWSMTLYEFTSGGVSTSKGTCTATYNAAASTTTHQTSTCTMNNVQWAAAVGSRLKVRIQIVAGTGWGRPALLWGANRVTSGTLAGQTYFTAGLGVPSSAPPAPTLAPANLTFTRIDQTFLTLSWSAVTNATSYIVERSPAGANTWVQVGQPVSTSLTDDCLTPNTGYDYRVRGTNRTGSGPNATATATTAASRTAGSAVPWTGSFGTFTLTCSSCHGDPPGGTHPSADNCSACHPGYADKGTVPQTVDKSVHINGVLNTGDCTGCHAIAIGARRAVVAEFGLKWSHKRSAGGAVTKWDCIVCHMEGDPTTGDPVTAFHNNTVVNLRDPDRGTNIRGVTFAGTPGSYTETATDVTFTAFSRNLNATLESEGTNFATLAAIQINHCLKCHDSDGATAYNTGFALNPMATASRYAAIPFGTPISYASWPAAEGGTATAPSGLGVTAGGVSGGVIDVNASFATTNSSYHPIRGKQNNWYAKDTRMVPPWDMGVTVRSGTVNITTWGPLLSCWDCHALPTDAGVITKTITAHGGTVTARGNGAATTVGTPDATSGATLCWVCHKGYREAPGGGTDNHGTGSALAAATNTTMTAFLQYGCNRCHASNYTTVVIRPVRAEDVHGFDRLPGTGTDVMWPTGTTETTKPYAFIRNTKSLSNHTPGRVGATTYTPTCVHLTDSPCSSRTGTYTPGGTY